MKRCRGKEVETSVTHEKTSKTEFEKPKVWIRWQFRCSVLPFGSEDSFQCSKAEDVISASSGPFSTHTVRFQGRLLHSDCNWIQFFSVGNEVRRCSGTCNPTAQCVWDLCLFIGLFFLFKNARRYQISFQHLNPALFAEPPEPVGLQHKYVSKVLAKLELFPVNIHVLLTHSEYKMLFLIEH